MRTTTMTSSRPGRRRLTRAGGMLVAAGLVLAAAACGSDDGDVPDPPDFPDIELTRTAEPGEAVIEDDAEPEAASGDYCGLLESMGQDVLAGIGSTDPGATAGLVDSYREIAAAAPDDVAADWTAMADAMETLADLDMSDPEAATEQLAELEDLQTISTDLGAHVQSECG